MNLIFGTSTYKPAPPSTDTVNKAKELFKVLERRWTKGKMEEWNLLEVYEILKECTNLESLLSITNEDGYNVMQAAVILDDSEFLELLLEESCSLNHGKCSLPLQLACQMGNLAMVQFLLQNGADRHLERGMCYPKPHKPVRHVPSRFHFLETNIYMCDSNHHLPLMFAIKYDHFDIVRLLLSGKSGYDHHWPYNRQPLHYACEFGAKNCIKYLAKLKPDAINELDENGLTPLMHAVPWGKSNIYFLEECGASVQLVSIKRQTALHLLYCYIKNPLEIYETTKFLVGTGLEQYTSVTDNKENTAMMELIALVNRKSTSFPAPFNEHDQSQVDTVILQTINLLLKNNCDPNIKNAGGVAALHKLILMFDFITNNDPTGISLESLPSRETYKVDFGTFYKTMDILVSNGADPNLASGAGRTPLVMILQTILNVDAAKFCDYSDGFLRCISLLCRHMANPSCNLTVHIAVVTCLAKLGQKCLSQRDSSIKGDVSLLLKNTLAELFQNGLRSNHCSMMRKRSVEGASGNVLVEMVKLAQYMRQPSDLDFIYDWVLTSLQFGANPDIEPYPSDPIICHSQSNIFLKPKGTQPVNQFMYEIQDLRQLFEGGYVEKLLFLFYNSMDHRPLYCCLNSAKVMSRFDPNRSPTFSFIQMISALSSQPRSLRQIARVAIYKAIDRQLNLRVQHLPLPMAMKTYLTELQ